MKSGSKIVGAKALLRTLREQRERYSLRLFVTGATPSSLRAIRNIRRICEAALPGNYDLLIVDIYQQPELARTEQIVAAPTLVKDAPPPVRRIIGDMSDENRVRVGLNLPTIPSLA